MPRGVTSVCPCKICEGGWLERRRVRRHSEFGTGVGALLMVGSVLWVGGALIWLPQLELLRGMGLLTLVGAAVAFTLGLTLLEKKRILQCDTCGAVTPAS